MRKFLLPAVLFVFALGAHAEERIKIGVSTPLTGEAAPYGIDFKNILTFANEKIAGGKYELIFEDDKCSGRDAVAVAHKFVSILKVKYVLGFPCSGAVLAAAPVYEKAGVLVIAAGASAEAISNSGDYIFRTWPSDVVASRKFYEFLASKHKTIGALSEETDYAQAFLKSVTAANADNKLVIHNENFLSSVRDFRSVLLRLKTRGVGALFLNSQTEGSLGAIVKDIRTMQWQIPIYNAWFAGGATFLKSYGDIADGIIYMDFASGEESFGADGKKLFAEYLEKFGPLLSVEISFTTCMESMRALHQAIESGKDVREYLYTTRFQGLFGEWFFDKSGDIQGLTPVMKIIENRKPRGL